jgi:hypothetical protein
VGVKAAVATVSGRFGRPPPAVTKGPGRSQLSDKTKETHIAGLASFGKKIF